MKLLITGHGRHGKDTTCELFQRHFGMTFVSSSHFVAERAVVPYLAAKGIVYDTLDLCYADRANHRKDWYDAIVAYNADDPARMGRELLSQYDIYCGLRNRVELEAMRQEGLFNLAIWVDRSHHLPPEPETSMTIRPEDCDMVLDNNGSLADLGVLVARLYISLFVGGFQRWQSK